MYDDRKYVSGIYNSLTIFQIVVEILKKHCFIRLFLRVELKIWYLNSHFCKENILEGKGRGPGN